MFYIYYIIYYVIIFYIKILDNFNILSEFISIFKTS